MTTHAPTIRTASFEGPIELLLQLIEKRKLSVNEVSLAEVTDTYISHVRELESLPMGQLTHFLLVASTLVLIKSKSLLPLFETTEEEEEDIENLEYRLALYKLYKRGGEQLAVSIESPYMFERQTTAREVVFAPDPKLSSDKLYEIACGVVAETPEEEESIPEKRIEAVMNIDDMMTRIEATIQQSGTFAFSDFTSTTAETEHGAESKGKANSYKVVGFLALLEMIRNGIVTASQDTENNDIIISNTE